MEEKNIYVKQKVTRLLYFFVYCIGTSSEWRPWNFAHKAIYLLSKILRGLCVSRMLLAEVECEWLPDTSRLKVIIILRHFECIFKCEWKLFCILFKRQTEKCVFVLNFGHFHLILSGNLYYAVMNVECCWCDCCVRTAFHMLGLSLLWYAFFFFCKFQLSFWCSNRSNAICQVTNLDMKMRNSIKSDKFLKLKWFPFHFCLSLMDRPVW